MFICSDILYSQNAYQNIPCFLVLWIYSAILNFASYHVLFNTKILNPNFDRDSDRLSIIEFCQLPFLFDTKIPKYNFYDCSGQFLDFEFHQLFFKFILNFTVQNSTTTFWILLVINTLHFNPPKIRIPQISYIFLTDPF